MKLNIGVVDLGINNLFSIDNAIKYLGYSSQVSSDNKMLEKQIKDMQKEQLKLLEEHEKHIDGMTHTTENEDSKKKIENPGGR